MDDVDRGPSTVALSVGIAVSVLNLACHDMVCGSDSKVFVCLPNTIWSAAQTYYIPRDHFLAGAPVGIAASFRCAYDAVIDVIEADRLHKKAQLMRDAVKPPRIGG